MYAYFRCSIRAVYICFFLAVVLPRYASGSENLTLSVLYFQTVETESKYAYLNKALAEMLIGDLVGVDGLTLVEREQLEKVASEIALGQSGMIDETSAPEVGKMLGASCLITGTIIPNRKEVVVQYKILSVEKAQVVAGSSVTGRPDRIIGLKNDLSASVIDNLKKRFPQLSLSSVPATGVDEQEISLDRIEEYGKALELSDKGEYQKARDIINEMLGSVPKFSYGRKLLDDLQKRIESYDKTREAIIEEQKKEPMNFMTFQQMTVNYTTSMEYTKLLLFCLTFKDNPPKEPQGSLITGAELVQYNIVFAYYMLKKWDCFLEEGEIFLKKFPTSMYYSMIKMYVNQGMQEVKKLEGERVKALETVKKIEEKAAKEKGVKKHSLYLQIAQEYFNGGLYPEALQWLKKIDTTPDVMGKFGVTEDLVLYQMFMCYYNLFSKDDAQKVYDAVSSKYPESSYLDGMTTLISMFPQ